MRVILAVMMSAVILLPLQASAATEQFWDHARYDSDGVQVDGGTIGFTTHWNLSSNNDTGENHSYSVDEMPILVEIYTATWCTNCVTTQDIMNEAIGDLNVEIIHYHRHWFEPRDPFGSNSTEERWTNTYGHAVTLNGGAPRLAPTKVVDGERMHYGSRANSDSLMDDYTASLSKGPNGLLNGNISLDIHQTENYISFDWDISSLAIVTQEEYTLEPWILLIEEEAYFPDGSNGLETYEHVLLEAHSLDSSENSSGALEVPLPSLWDGDDLKVAILVDWLVDSSPSESPLPPPSIVYLLTSLVAIAYVRGPRLS